jgi:hypothetical protein
MSLLTESIVKKFELMDEMLLRTELWVIVKHQNTTFLLFIK